LHGAKIVFQFDALKIFLFCGGGGGGFSCKSHKAVNNFMAFTGSFEKQQAVLQDA